MTIKMASRLISDQHFYLYLLCVLIVGGFDLYNSIVRLKPEKKNNQRSESAKKKSKTSKDKGT